VAYQILNKSVQLAKGSHGETVRLPSSCYIFSIGVQNMGMHPDVYVVQNFVQTANTGYVALNNQSRGSVEIVIWVVFFNALTPKMSDAEVHLEMSQLP
jgi:hypothetical protein